MRRRMGWALALSTPLTACADYQLESETVVVDGGPGALRDAAGAVDTQPSDGGGAGPSEGGGAGQGTVAELVKKLNEARDVYANGGAVYWSRDNTIELCPLPCNTSWAIWSAPGVVPANRRFSFVPPPNNQAAYTVFFGASAGSGPYMAKHTLLTSTPLNVGPAPLAIAADQYNAYFSSGSAIHMMYVSATSSAKLLDIAVPAEGLALTPNALFWHSTAATGAGGTGGIYGCSRATCTSATEVVSPQAARAVGALHATTTEFYFADNHGVATALGGASLFSCPATATTCTPSLIVSGEAAVGSIAVNNGYIYWSNGGATSSATGMIRGCKLGACVPTTLAANLPRPVAISASAPNDLYVAAYGLAAGTYSGGIYRIPKLK